MIVDMVRNDLGRIARTGTVKTTRLFDVERYPTVWQLTSTVEAESEASLPEIFSALFPSASVTGAPKVRTMAIIGELEASPRGNYTGAAGWLAPGGDASFNVSIRTVWIDRAAGEALYGTGGGVVWDSDAESEYAECLAKTRILADPVRSFDLLETLKWEPDAGYTLLTEHLDRLAESAAYFGFAVCRDTVAERLRGAAATWTAPRRVRLLAAPDGALRIEHAAWSPPPAPPTRVAWAPAPVHTSEIRLYHKTTDRQIYDEARRARPDCDDVLLWNERGELCEATVANVAARIGGDWITPPLSCGLLPGVMRRRLLETGRLREGVIPRREITPGTELALFNSVRGWCPARLVQDG
jgi:para-aminobenzoate synthetase/4-amino-4-deoxychorismate lyase